MFEDRAEDAATTVQPEEQGRSTRNKVDVATDRIFVGLDAYKKVLATDVNYVILATPPGFRPIHLEAAVEAGKNIFTEKPVARGRAGIRKVLGAGRGGQEEEPRRSSPAPSAGTRPATSRP